MVSSKTPMIDILVEAPQWRKIADLEALVDKSILAVIQTAGLKFPNDAELSLVFTNDQSIARINKQWRGINKPTNVLSFPGADLEPGQRAHCILGDIILAYETLNTESKDLGIETSHHLTHLIVHGFLHLFGYDHQTDQQAQQMEQLERKTLARLNIADPYA